MKTALSTLFTTLCMALATLLAPINVEAYYYEDPQGVYWGGFGAFTASTNARWVSSPAPVEAYRMSPEFGWGSGVSLGYQTCLGFRIEGELAYRTADIDDLIIEGVSQNSDGKYQIFTAMVNFFYEAETLFFCTPIRPFIGVGAGVANIAWEHRSPDTLIDDSCEAVAYQVIMGIGYPITKCLMISGEYRFLGLTDQKLDGSTGVHLEGKGNMFINSVGVSFKWVI